MFMLNIITYSCPKFNNSLNIQSHNKNLDYHKIMSFALDFDIDSSAIGLMFSSAEPAYEYANCL